MRPSTCASEPEITMYFEHSDRTKEWIGRVSKFMDDHIIPAVPTYEAQQKGRAVAGR